jgi:uncharacterized protein YkwD
VKKVFLLILTTLTVQNAMAAAAPTSEVARLVNVERKKRGLRLLKGNSVLAQIASGHARDMYHREYFSHQSTDGRTMRDRFEDANFDFRYAGENIARGQKTAQRVMTAWMNSPGHRKNILNPRFGRIGVAKAGTVWVQNFAN